MISAWSRPLVADRGVVLVGRLAVAVGERATGLLDDHPDRGHVVDRDADRVDRHVDGALGDEHVLPEVAEARGRAGTVAAARRAGRSGRAGPSRR